MSGRRNKQGGGAAGAVVSVLIVGALITAVVLLRRGKLGKLNDAVKGVADKLGIDTQALELDLWNAKQQKIKEDVERENAAWMAVYNQSGGVSNQGAPVKRVENITTSNTFMYKGIGLTVVKFSTGEYYQVAAKYNGTLDGYTEDIQDGLMLDPITNCHQASDPHYCQLWNEIRAEIRRRLANGSLKPPVINP